ncbi:hypothetical protein XAC2852_150194 [Xanthomonas citri pv. citri]|uniref:Uncharacterized protein n=1 Tax=Xanthomonas citri pv. citri TaxID=611301 RepID=A0A0U5F8M7_XANCI|nr:hypothetical protein HZS93_00819 [Xanthomonas citri]CEE17992.1 hypothetical protein XAC9322_140125 [Xanthomonas citri pv. citri]CEE18938.1 hypothetical protein XAC1083_140192 [Xanthomonas citri pv. citri]CEE25964.1 hypothetical protein XAC2911_120191 [Xanthomonas citri pv. citri]CEE52878.1 hypothetical protein XAC71A_160138 [Xanthomonas citri pv. citri]
MERIGNDGCCQRPHPPFGHLLPQAGEGRKPVCLAAPEPADPHTHFDQSRIPALEPYRTVWYVRHVLPPPNHGCIAVAAGPSRPGFAWETAA